MKYVIYTNQEMASIELNRTDYIKKYGGKDGFISPLALEEGMDK